MLSPELKKKVQNIYIKSRFLANDVFAGEYETAFRGHGMEFEEVREYDPGDDIRSIDWNVSARMGHPYVKVFREEREQTLMLMLDLSASLLFGSRGRLKQEMATEIAAVLAYAAIRCNDKVGLIIFSDHVERYIPPKKERSHVWRIIAEILSFEARGTKTNIDAALAYFNRVIKKRCVCFIISDFIDQNFQRSLRLAGFKHDLCALIIRDALEQKAPPAGLVSVKDLETARVKTVDLSSAHGREFFRLQQKKFDAEIIQQMMAANADVLSIATHEDTINSLLQFFRMRDKRL